MVEIGLTHSFFSAWLLQREGTLTMQCDSLHYTIPSISNGRYNLVYHSMSLVNPVPFDKVRIRVIHHTH